MDRFSQAYDKARTVVTTQEFAPDWKAFLTKEIHVGSLLDSDGPNLSHAAGLDKLRGKLAKAGGVTGAKIAEAIISASKASEASGKLDERAATLKMLKHFYLARKRGGQDVWVYSPPKSYAQWIYDEIKGTENSLKGKLVEEAEVYTDDEKKLMCDALLLALNWSLGATTKLADANLETEKAVRRWFADEDTTDEQLATAIGSLNAGFKKIAQVANSNRLVFSDEPVDRNSGGWKDWAYVYESEKQEVIYLQGAYLKAGNSGKTWMCALTIIHELSHRAVGTDDHRYDTDGIKPSRATLSYEKALDNADSWAYFAVDLAGKLSNSDSSNVLR